MIFTSENYFNFYSDFKTKCCYVLGLIFFAGNSLVQYYLFLGSISLVGVLANAWTVVLEGNFHMSIVLTIVNTILACGKRKIELNLTPSDSIY